MRIGSLGRGDPGRARVQAAREAKSGSGRRPADDRARAGAGRVPGPGLDGRRAVLLGPLVRLLQRQLHPVHTDQRLHPAHTHQHALQVIDLSI